MFRVALASVLGNKIRLALTALAIVIGVAFVTGSFVLTDSIDRAFGNLLADVNEGTDVYVNGVSDVERNIVEDDPGQGATVPQEVADEVRAVDGVAEVTPVIEGVAVVVSPEGEAVGGMGPPSFAYSWSGPEETGPLTLQEGRSADGPDEATLDAATAETTGYEVGDTMPVQLADGVHEFELVGITGFGDEDNLLGATIVTFDLATAQSLLDREGEYDQLAVIGAGEASPEDLRDRIEEAITVGNVEVVTASDELASQQAEVREGLSFINIALLTFAGIAVFVGIFLIVNTFSIIVAQRTREFALLRAVGASARQVRLAVVIEAMVVGLVAGIVGIVAGIGLSELMRAVFNAIGMGFPDGGLILQARTIIIAMVLGVVVTTLASIGPSRRASRVSPMEALRADAGGEADTLGRGRTVVGTIAALAGVAGLALGLADVVAQPAVAAGAGAALAFVGVALLAPYLAGPAANLIGALPSRRGVPGRLARNNADDNPKRTASTASALMIGVALVSFVSIFAASATASVNVLFTDQLGSDYTVSPSGFGPGGVPPALTADLEERSELGAVSPAQGIPVSIDDDTESMMAVNGDQIEQLVFLDVAEGSTEQLDGGVLVHEERAKADGLAVGDPLDVRFEGADTTLTVTGIFANRDLIGTDLITDLATLDAVGVSGTSYLVFANGAEGVDAATARAAVDEVADAYVGVQVQDQVEMAESMRGQVDTLLNVIIGLLALALVIALIGIINTLALSVFERTREIGLLRAVGMTRAQVRSMVRWESVIVSVFGAVLGVAVGAVFGWSLVTASAESGLEVLEFPTTRLVVYVVVAAIAGVVAAVLPARRAARLDILRAVTTE